MGEYLKNAVVIVTGASKGIGQGVAVEFARCGSKLTISGRDEKALAETAKLCQEAGAPESHVHMILGDVTKEEDCKNIVEGTVTKYGQLNVLVNIAGATRVRTIDTLEIEDLDWCYNILVKSVVMMTKLAIPHLEKTKGNIVNMSSTSGLRPLHYAVPYSMCKCMLDRFTQVSAKDLAKKGIRINNINPATIRTPMLDYMFAGNKDKQIKYEEWACKAIPARRLGEIGEVARAATFLASNDVTSWMTGVLFAVDGSYSNTTYHPVLLPKED